MRNRQLCAHLLLLPLLLLICGCSKEERVPEEMEAYYNQFIAAFSEGDFEDVDPFLHFEIADYREMTKEFFCNVENPRTECWEKIQDDLWVAHTYVESAVDSEGRVVYHFVGRVDGELKVMIGPFQVPKELYQDADLTKYIPPDALIPNEFYD